MVVVHVVDSLALIIATEAALLETNADIISAAHYKPSVCRETQITRHKDVGGKDDHKFMLDWKSEVQLLDDYTEYHDKFLKMLSKFWSM